MSVRKPATSKVKQLATTMLCSQMHESVAINNPAPRQNYTPPSQTCYQAIGESDKTVQTRACTAQHLELRDMLQSQTPSL